MRDSLDQWIDRSDQPIFFVCALGDGVSLHVRAGMLEIRANDLRNRASRPAAAG
jgi:hypothetical protein